MKEIGKLLELLNEYENQLDLKGCTRSEQPNFIGHIKAVSEYSDNILYNADLAVTSKRYGFIKWLVENNKIDEDKLFINDYGMVTSYIDAFGNSCKFDEYEKILMLLSIQDEPIRFLCEIIK